MEIFSLASTYGKRKIQGLEDDENSLRDRLTRTGKQVHCLSEGKNSRAGIIISKYDTKVTHLNYEENEA